MYICNNCQHESLKWNGQCSYCKEFNTFEEVASPKKWNNKMQTWTSKPVQSISGSDNKDERVTSKSSEFDSALWGWIVTWSLILLSWEPGIWKSTLTLQISDWLSQQSIIYVSWEETQGQIISRSKRLGIPWNNVSILTNTNIEDILETLKTNQSDIVIIDSVSVMHSMNIPSSAGSVNQVRYITEQLMHYAKEQNTTVILIGHVTKDWNLAWPKTLEHMVDTVLYLEWDKFDTVRILRCFKNRFGPSHEIWIFRMEWEWLKDLPNPWLEFMSHDEAKEVLWAALSMTIEWSRPLLVECESLTAYTKFWYPKRNARWIHASKLDMLIAILWKYSKVKLDSYDVYSNIARGLKVDDPGIDLALLASIISSKQNKWLSRDTIFIWEVSLTWKIKNVFNIEKRIKEAEKLGFKTIYIPKTPLKWKYKINVIEAKDVWDFIWKM